MNDRQRLLGPLLSLFEAEWARVGISGADMLASIWAVDLPTAPSGNGLRAIDHELVSRVLRELPDGAGSAAFAAAYRSARADLGGQLRAAAPNDR